MDIQEVIRQSSGYWWYADAVGGALCFIGSLLLVAATIVGAQYISVSYRAASVRKAMIGWHVFSCVVACGLIALGGSAYVLPAKQDAWLKNYAKPYAEALPWKTVQAESAKIVKKLGENRYEGTVYYQGEEGMRVAVSGEFIARKSENGQSEFKFKEVPKNMGYGLDAGKYMAELTYAFVPTMAEGGREDAGINLRGMQMPIGTTPRGFWIVACIEIFLCSLTGLVMFMMRSGKLREISFEEEQRGREVQRSPMRDLAEALSSRESGSRHESENAEGSERQDALIRKIRA